MYIIIEILYKNYEIYYTLILHSESDCVVITSFGRKGEHNEYQEERFWLQGGLFVDCIHGDVFVLQCFHRSIHEDERVGGY